MLRVTVLENVLGPFVLLEGKLMSVWVEELRKTWRDVQLKLQNRAIKVDVSELSFVSDEGQRLILEMMADGATFQGGGVYIRHLINELEIQADKSKLVTVKPQQIP